jgi:small subunit ribosomal protein S23e
VCSLFYSPFL